ncbi:MAG: acyl-CoA dehydratase activase [Cytophagales bacterium]|nr:acyl-CoA dehydratase activase [Cytophagales bacterium]
MEMQCLGIDLGSTTAKVVVIDRTDAVTCSAYRRHNTRIVETLKELLLDILNQMGDVQLHMALSGSAGMGIAEKTGIPFIQEVLAASLVAKKKYTGIKSLLDIGGEDAKLVLFDERKKPDIRMNGNCAGGTGAYIDQMATLLNVPVEELNDLAWSARRTYPIAARCGVFAKTDVQNLISRKISIEEIAGSIFEAVASQVIGSLARGCTINAPLIFCGGPLTYISYLREAILKQLKIDPGNSVLPSASELFIALGAALSVSTSRPPVLLSQFLNRLSPAQNIRKTENGLQPLFANDQELDKWNDQRKKIQIPNGAPANEESCFLGIDSGSTTTKVVVINKSGKLLYQFYKNNNGHSLETVVEGLKLFKHQLDNEHKTVAITKSAVTGYGEDLIRTALGLDYGIVETVAHFIAARELEPEVSFILDIGGQDMKAIYVQSNTISDIEINEACSSGCGSFIESFANTLGYDIPEFSEIALLSGKPYDLGSRCTVFMNSKVKQALREGASVEDLSAGLAYSIVKNCLYKVLKIKNSAGIGDNIVVQGGTFRNKAVYRAFEVLSEKKIVTSDLPELMGAYGAALYAAKKANHKQASHFTGLDHLDDIKNYTTRMLSCKGCANTCRVTVYTFPNGKKCFAGNKCEKLFSNSHSSKKRGDNIFEHKKQILFGRDKSTAPGTLRIGIPRILNTYENYPFWDSLFSQCGFEVVLSDDSTTALYQKGNRFIMSENICFPAKLSHGHIINLVEKKADRIFFPFVVYEKKEFHHSANSYNCPIVTGYSEVLKSSSELLEPLKIPFDSPGINFNDKALLRKACLSYVLKLGINKTRFVKAFDTAVQEQDEFKQIIRQKNREILNRAIRDNAPVVLMAAHPYHMDTLIHQRASQILSGLGVHVINEEIASECKEGFSRYFAVSQWAYPNRILQAAWWVSRQKYPVGLIQLNSFGCGPDAFITDEINDLAKKNNIPYALIRIDEIASPGSLKLRLRSLVESLNLRRGRHPVCNEDHMNGSPTAVFKKSDRRKTILVPWFSDFYSPFIPVLGKLAGYKLVNLPPSDRSSADLGLSHANNEICYPATLVVGDIIKALESSQYNPDEIAVGITQTGGQCRATNYLALIKRAMAKAGYGHVPIVSVAPADGLYNLQPGFDLDWKKMIRPVFFGLIFVDSLTRLYYATVSREKHKSASNMLRNKYLAQAKELIGKNDHRALYSLLKNAVRDFNAVEVLPEKIPAVGVVGEIYIKYNSYGQFNIIDWLIQNRIEVAIPPLFEFLMQSFVNGEAMKSSHIAMNSGTGIISKLLEWEAEHHIRRYERLLGEFRFYRPVYPIRQNARYASEIVSLANQYGEGWLIPAEIASFARQDIADIICMQPFGCIANHIIGKGIEKKIKHIYPDVNLLFLDFDSGTSKVNLLNRLHFLIQNQKQSVPFYES